jgi:peptidoglycan L-alanyl-D-glutamate endopeptidase CwlK
MFSFSKRSIRNMTGVHPELILVFMTAIKRSPIDFGVPNDGGVRTAVRQNQMFNDQDIKTKCDGYKLISEHQIKEGEEFGMALDIYAYVGGKASWNKIHLAIVAGVILATAKDLKQEGKINIDLKWGGTFGSTSFNGWDYPHFQIVRH